MRQVHKYSTPFKATHLIDQRMSQLVKIFSQYVDGNHLRAVTVSGRSVHWLIRIPSRKSKEHKSEKSFLKRKSQGLDTNKKNSPRL